MRGAKPNPLPRLLKVGTATLAGPIRAPKNAGNQALTAASGAAAPRRQSKRESSPASTV